MKFLILSRNAAKRYSYGNIPKTIIISITDVGSMPKVFDKNSNLVSVLSLQFNDATADEFGCMTEDDADRIIKFVNIFIGSVEQIVVHCEAGISRSAGVAAALMAIINGNDDEVFKDPKYCPNSHCYRLLLNRYYGTYGEQAIEQKFKENIELWNKENL